MGTTDKRLTNELTKGKLTWAVLCRNASVVVGEVRNPTQGSGQPTISTKQCWILYSSQQFKTVDRHMVGEMGKFYAGDNCGVYLQLDIRQSLGVDEQGL